MDSKILLEGIDLMPSGMKVYFDKYFSRQLGMECPVEMLVKMLDRTLTLLGKGGAFMEIKRRHSCQ